MTLSFMNEMSELMSARYRINTPQVISEIIDGEAVLIHMDKGYYYSLNTTGAFIWERLERRMQVVDLLDDCTACFMGNPAEIQSAARGLIETLVEEELISLDSSESADSDGPAPLSGEGARSIFSPPTLEKFTDMREFLLVDPIHEVDDRGWPHKATKSD